MAVVVLILCLAYAGDVVANHKPWVWLFMTSLPGMILVAPVIYLLLTKPTDTVFSKDYRERRRRDQIFPTMIVETLHSLVRISTQLWPPHLTSWFQLFLNPSPGTIGCRSQYQMPSVPVQEPGGASRRGLCFMRRQPSGVFALDLREPRVVRQVLPFVGIVAVVVELLGAVGVADVPPALRTDRVASPIVRRDGRPGARGVRVLELGTRLWPSRPCAGRQAAELDQGRVKVEQLRGAAQVAPAETPGPAKMSGTRVERSQSEFLPVIPFSPRCQPWSDQRTTTVSSARPVASRASSTRPTWLSMKLVLAR